MALRFANLGSTPGNHSIKAIGNLYGFMVEDSSTAIIFDPRTYIATPPSDEHQLRFKRIGYIEIPILPQLKLEKADIPTQPLFKGFDPERAYVVNLTSEEPTMIGWCHLKRLLPTTELYHIPLGRDNWSLVHQESFNRDVLRAIESTDLVESGRMIELEDYTIFLFESKHPGNPASILVTGEARGKNFAFFFGETSFRKFFENDCVETISISLRPTELHWLVGGGCWNAFIPEFLTTEETLPVKELAAEQT